MRKIKVYFLMFFSLCLTIFVFLNSFETVLNINLPVVSAIDKIDLNKLSNYSINSDLRQSAIFNVAKYGTPNDLRVAGNHKIEIVPSIFNDGWLARTNTGHYSFIKVDDKQEVFFIYMRQSSITIGDPQNLKLGDNIAVDTNQGWRYLFRVEKTSLLDNDKNIVIEEDRNSKVIIISQDIKGNHCLVTGRYITTEKVGDE